MVLIVVDMSIKNDIATAISHIYREQEIIVKITYYVTNKVEIFTIRYEINHTIHLPDINCIIIIIDTILTAR